MNLVSRARTWLALLTVLLWIVSGVSPASAENAEEILDGQPIVRIVFHPNPAVNERWLERWSKILAHWVREGLSPIVFVHSPSNRESPAIARDLHARIGALEPVGEMPSWPGEAGESASGQLALL